MKRHIIAFTSLLLLLLSVISPVKAQSASDFLKISGTAFTYKGTNNIYLRGANIHNTPWDNNWKGEVNNIIITEADYQKMAEMGGNHFRFGITYGMWHYQKTQFYQMMDQQISWGKKHGIWIIPVLFSTPNDQISSGWACNNLAGQETALGDFWVDFATHYKNEPVIAGFDIINEPGWCNGWDYWFNMAERIAARINAADPNHLSFISSTDDGSFPRKINGNYIVYEMHQYEPGGGTHCQDTTQKFTYPGTFTMWSDPNTYWDKAAMAAPYNGNNAASLEHNIPLMNWGKQNNIPVYVGEWGMASPACVKGAGQYETDFSQLLIERGLSQAYYVWRHAANYWGIFPHEKGNFTPNFQEKFNAAKASFANAYRPNFTGGTTNPTVTPTKSPTPTPHTTQPTATKTPTPRPGTPTPTPSTVIPNPPSWFNELPPNLKDFLQQLYLTVYYFHLPSNLTYLLDGIVP